jgi:hypothetical protein
VRHRFHVPARHGEDRVLAVEFGGNVPFCPERGFLFAKSTGIGAYGLLTFFLLCFMLVMHIHVWLSIPPLNLNGSLHVRQ